jgi:hypothetical protein
MMYLHDLVIFDTQQFEFGVLSIMIDCRLRTAGRQLIFGEAQAAASLLCSKSRVNSVHGPERNPGSILS